MAWGDEVTVHYYVDGNCGDPEGSLQRLLRAEKALRTHTCINNHIPEVKLEFTIEEVDGIYNIYPTYQATHPAILHSWHNIGDDNIEREVHFSDSDEEGGIKGEIKTHDETWEYLITLGSCVEDDRICETPIRLESRAVH